MTKQLLQEVIRERDYVELGPYDANEFIRKTGWDFTPYGLPDEDASDAILIRFIAERDGIPVIRYRITADIGPDEYGGWGNTISEDVCDPTDQELVLDSLCQVLQEMEGWTEEETTSLRAALEAKDSM